MRLRKLWKEGTDCSMPLKDDDDELVLTIGGRLSVPDGCGLELGIAHPSVSPYVVTGLESTNMVANLIRYMQAWMKFEVFAPLRQGGALRRHDPDPC